jgi:hypothetical protein
MDDTDTARIEALIEMVGAILSSLDIESTAADLWPETMRKGTPEEISAVTAELADEVSLSLFKRLRNPDTAP